MGIDTQMKNFVTNLLNSSVCSAYAYHNYKHTLYVYDKALEIANHEHCTPQEIHLLKAAALWHDAGYINIYDGHEEESCVLARMHLPQFNFTASEINRICAMIMATKIPQTAGNLLEAIIADADLEYLGTGEAASQAEDLFIELCQLNPLLTKTEWNRIQVSFLQRHHYFTKYCKEIKEPVKQAYLTGLINDIK